MDAPTVTREMAAPGLIWGFDFQDGRAVRVDETDLARRAPAQAFRWLHFNLADQRSHRWLSEAAFLSDRMREVMTAPDRRQRYVVEGETAGFVLEDIERDFADNEPRVGLIRFLVSPGLMVTGRMHPLRSGDLVRQKLMSGAVVEGGAAALDLQLEAMAEALHGLIGGVDEQVQEIEDDLLKDGRDPDAKTFVALRSLMARMRRLLSGQRAVFRQVELDRDFPAGLAPAAVRAMHRLSALDTELMAMQGQLRLLREELDLQATQRTNQNLYILSMLTALMLPATLVTGVFGMNTAGLPFAHSPAGTVIAIVLAVAASAAVYVALRMLGFVRR